MDDSVLEALRRAVAAAPQDTVLRLHLAESLVAAGRSDEAIGEIAAVLQQEPDSRPARAMS